MAGIGGAVFALNNGRSTRRASPSWCVICFLIAVVVGGAASVIARRSVRSPTACSSTSCRRSCLSGFGPATPVILGVLLIPADAVRAGRDRGDVADVGRQAAAKAGGRPPGSRRVRLAIRSDHQPGGTDDGHRARRVRVWRRRRRCSRWSPWPPPPAGVEMTTPARVHDHGQGRRQQLRRLHRPVGRPQPTTRALRGISGGTIKIGTVRPASGTCDLRPGDHGLNAWVTYVNQSGGLKARTASPTSSSWSGGRPTTQPNPGAGQTRRQDKVFARSATSAPNQTCRSATT